MAIHVLTPREVQTLTDGQHSDGGGLFLRINDSSANWIYRYTGPDGKRRDMGLGPAERSSIAAAGESIKRARELARFQRQLLDAGKDPLEHRRKLREQAQREAAATKAQTKATALTLCRAARDYHERVIEPRFTDKHGKLWIASLENNVPLAIWHKPIDQITPVELFEAIAELRKRIPETADRVRQRLDKVFDDAAFFGRCTSNPARIIRSKVSETPRGRKEGNYLALAYSEVPVFYRALRDQPGSGSRALEFALLTAARTGEVLGARWEEFEEANGVWRVPGTRMKGGETHTVYLPEAARAILADMGRLGGLYVFPSPRSPNRPLSGMAMLEVLKRMGYNKRTTVHGVCRASFSTWANETGAGRPEVIEACLAHREADRVRAAYNRASFDTERRALLAAWSNFCLHRESVGRGATVEDTSASKALAPKPAIRTRVRPPKVSPSQ
jgi:integrase